MEIMSGVIPNDRIRKYIVIQKKLWAALAESFTTAGLTTIESTGRGIGYEATEDASPSDIDAMCEILDTCMDRVCSELDPMEQMAFHNHIKLDDERGITEQLEKDPNAKISLW